MRSFGKDETFSATQQCDSNAARSDVSDGDPSQLIGELRRAQEQLRADLEATTRLVQIGSLFLQEGNLTSVLDEILDGAIAISGSAFGNIQLIDPDSGDLRIVVHRGFPEWWLRYWEGVTKGKGACGSALEQGKRVIVEDVS